LGDAACAFNPIYGQGMTTASLEAGLLSRLLIEVADPRRMGRTFQREVARILRSPWTLATSSDLRFSSVTGARAGLVTRFMHAYIDRVLRLSTADPWARRRFLEVQGMTRELSAVLRPDVLWRIACNRVPVTTARSAGRAEISKPTVSTVGTRQ
jgi:2-polyprenyl-6-methoxyphenol hydroxylase-like FAD-dependent oxidoreductase